MGHDQLTNFQFTVSGTATRGSMEIKYATDEFLEAVATAMVNRMAVPIPTGLPIPEGLGRLVIDDYRVELSGPEIMSFAGTVTVAVERTVYLEVHAEP